MGYDWPRNWQEKPILTHVEGNTVYFKDGTSKNVHAIISCTGYLHQFPFMDDDLRMISSNRLWVPGVFQGVVWQKNPKLLYLGMQDQYYTFNMFDAQAWYARYVILGRIELPDLETMEADSKTWSDRQDALKDYKEEIDFQGDYVQHLVDQTDYPDFDIPNVNAMFKQWKADKYEDIMGYRNKGYKSTLTGTQAPEHHTVWVDALDDTFETYLQTEA